MLTRLQLENFRGFKTLNLFPLKRINIIVGQSNTGKTGVLEALTLLLWEQPTRCGNLPNMFRASGGDWNENFWNWLIHGKRKDTSVVIRATFSNGPEFGLRLDSHPPHFPRMGDIVQSLGSLGSLQVFAIGGKETAGVKVSVFSTHPTDPKQDAIDYNRVVLRRRKKDVEAMLKKIEPRLEAIETLQTGNQPLLYADIGLSEMIPITQMGQGFNRLLDIYSELVVAEAKVLLIDEFENGLHHSVLSTIWRGLYTAATEMDVQIFATTHSQECIRAAHEVFSDQPDYDLGIIQLFRVPTGIEGRVLDRKHIEAAMAGEIDLR